MKQDPFALALLFDYYGALLTDKQRACFDLYYNQDLSLTEIAEQFGISRQGVHDSLARAEAALRQMEDTTGCVARDRQLNRALADIRRCAQQLAQNPSASVQQLAQEILSAADTLSADR